MVWGGNDSRVKELMMMRSVTDQQQDGYFRTGWYSLQTWHLSVMGSRPVVAFALVFQLKASSTESVEKKLQSMK